MKEKILLIVMPPIWPNLPPLGIAYISAHLERNNFFPVIKDLNAEIYNLIEKKWQKRWTVLTKEEYEVFFQYVVSEFNYKFEEIFDIIERENIKYIGFSVFKLNEKFIFKIADVLRKKEEDIKIIIGGPQIQYRVWEGKDLRSFYYFADKIIVGEGEKAIYKLRNNNKIYHEPVVKLSEVGFPEFKYFDLKNYKRKKALPVMFSRGCINRCAFCAETKLFDKFKTYNELDFVEYLLYLKKVYKIKWITFFDSLINGNLNKLYNLLDLMIKNKVELYWDAQIYIRNDMDDEIFQMMKKSGCVGLFIGLESGSDKVLKLMNKRYNTEIASRFLQALYKNNLFAEISLIYDFPGETEKDFEETLLFIKKNKKYIPKIAQINKFIPLPGTEAYSLAMDQNFQNSSSKKLEKFIHVIKENNIIYTESYIENLNLN